MQKLQLYINSERIDLFKDETVSISLSQQDTKDPKKIFAEFTKTFTIPASKENNKIFKHYYNFNIVNNSVFTQSGFDAREKIAASIELNNIPYKEGFVALNGVELKANKPYAYKITFYGKTINLTKTFRDQNLSALTGQLNTYNLDYDAATVKAKMQLAVGSVIICPLITHTAQPYYNTAETNTTANLYPSETNGLFFKELKYAIQVSTIVDAIQTEYGLDFSTDFFTSSNTTFENLYLWLNRKKGNIEPTVETLSYSTQVFGFTQSSWTSVEDATTMSTGATLNIVPGTDDLSENELELTPVTLDLGVTYTVNLIESSTGQYWSSGEVSGVKTFTKTHFGILPIGSYSINIVGITGMNFSQILWTLDGNAQMPAAPIGWQNIYQAVTAPVTSFEFTTVFEVVIGAQLPDIKVIDFMNALFNMFNLTAYYDNQTLLVNGSTNTNYGKIRIPTLDSFYDTNFNTWDISQYISTDSSQVNVGLPYNQIAFGYKGIKTYYSAQFTQLNNSAWGGLKYNGTGGTSGSSFSAPNKPYTIEIPLEHMQYVRLDDQNGVQKNIMTGWYVDDNRESYIGNPLLFYPVLLTASSTPAATPIALRETETGSTVSTLTSFLIPSNSVALDYSTSRANINFNNENNEWNITDNTQIEEFTETLFDTYYNTYISDVFNTRRRITNLKAYLPLQMLYKLQMNDVMTINNQDYIINTANINLITGESSLELLNKI